MKLEINDNTIRIRAHGRSLIIHCREEKGVEIISFEISDGHISRGGPLPDVELSERDCMLRHLGNRLEQIK